MYKRGKSFYSDFWHEGERYRKSWGPISRTIAREKEAKWKGEIRSGKYLQLKRRIRFETFAAKYIEEHVKIKKRPSTLRRYKASIKMLMPHFRGKLMAKINTDMVDSYMAYRQEEGRAPGTINRDVYTLRNMIKKAVDWKYLLYNPLTSMEHLKEDNEKTWALSDEQESRLLEECYRRPQRKKYLKDLVLFALHTGMRKGEILNLKKLDVRLKDRYVQVVDTKTHEDRNVPLNDTSVSILKSYLAESPSEYVFCNKHGEKLTVLTNAFWKAVEEAGLFRLEVDKKGKHKKIRFRFHDLRHTFGTRLGMAGYDLKTIMEIMGIKNPKTAMRYLHPSPAHKLEAVKFLDKTPPKFTTGKIVSFEN